MLCKCFGFSLLASVVVMASALADEVRGVITRVDLDKKEIVVQSKGRGVRKAALTFTLGKNTRVTVGRQAGNLENLSVGRRVRVQYEMQEEQRIATAIRVQGKKSSGAEGQEILGKLQRVALQDRQITVLGRAAKGVKKTEIILDLPANVQVTRAGKPLKLDQLQEGTFVRIGHRKKDGKIIATSIQVIDAQALISRTRQTMNKTRQTMNKADFYLKMAEWYLKTLDKPKKTEQK
jgi:predicted RNA-binding protein